MFTMIDDDLKRLIETSGAETRRHFDVVAEALRDEVRAEVNDVKHHFDVFAERVDKKVDLLAETMSLLDEKLERFRTDVNNRFDAVDMRFTDTQDLVKYSYTVIDRRVSALERRKR